METKTLPTSASLQGAIDKLKEWEGFVAFDQPGTEYLETERRYKEQAAAKVRELLSPESLDVDLLRERLIKFTRAKGFSNMMGWRDVPMVFKPLATEPGRDEDLREFFGALALLNGPDPDVEVIADRLAHALHGEEAGRLNCHMWAAISYLCAMFRPDRYVFVKPRVTDAFFKRLASSYRRPTRFSGAAYRALLDECERLVEELEAMGYPPKDMIDFQSLIWITCAEEVAEVTVRDKIRAAAKELNPSNPDGFTVSQIGAWLDENHPRTDGRLWESSMLQVGDYAVWADTDEICSPSTSGQQGYPKFLTCIDRNEPYRYRLIEERPNVQETVEGVATTGLYKHFRSRGLWFSEEVIANYALALKTKPFVILTGISGTGKTKLAQAFAEYMCPPEPREVIEAPTDTDTVYHFRASKTNFNQRHINVTLDLLPRLGVTEETPTPSFTLHLEGGPSVPTSLTAYPDATRNYVSRRLYLNGEAMNWLNRNVRLGDWLALKVNGSEMHLSVVKGRVHSAESTRHTFISVRPDWTDNRGLLGYYNPLAEKYVATELLVLLLRAARDPKRPHFVILDEMNLARVEHYFSDFLSCLESRRIVDGRLKQDPLILHQEPDTLTIEDRHGEMFEVPRVLEIPPNVYFTGTVNIDETTYMFSPKVLDRANTIEFNHVDLFAYGGLSKPAGEQNGLRLKEGYTLTACEHPCKDHFDRLDEEDRTTLAELNEILAPHQLHFGYRVANEIGAYLLNAAEHTAETVSGTALDLQVLQKVLPKLHGSKAKLEKPLAELHRFCEDDGRFPRSAAKLSRMRQVLKEQGYTSFVV